MVKRKHNVPIMTKRDNLRSVEDLQRISAREFLDVNDTAALLGCSPWTVRLWVKQGRLKPFKVSTKLLRFHRSAIDEFMGACQG